MKKGIFLSIVTSAVLFAGGDIVPAETTVSDADFWGQIGFFLRVQDNNYDDPAMQDYDFGDEENNNFAVTAVIGVEKEVGSGFGLGIELAGWSNLGWGIADGMLFKSDRMLSGKLLSMSGFGNIRNDNGGEISQAYLTYSFGNTGIKAGRQALTKSVSPWAFSDRTGGVIDVSYDGIVAANTDIADTTLLFAWIDQAYTASTMPEQNEVAGTVYAGEQYDLKNMDLSDNAGLFMLGMINKSISNTTLSLSAYYIPESKMNNIAANYNAARLARANRTAYSDTWSVWASAVGTVNNINWGLQFAYVDGDVHQIVAATGAAVPNSKWDATYGVAGKIGSSWGDLDAELVVSYINDGDYSFRTAGSRRGTSSAFWTFNGDFGGDTQDGEEQIAIVAKAGYKLGNGKLFGNIGYWEFDDKVLSAAINDSLDNALDLRLGYKFKLMDIDAQVEYRYRDITRTSNPSAGVYNWDETRQRVQVEAYYKF